MNGDYLEVDLYLDPDDDDPTALLTVFPPAGGEYVLPPVSGNPVRYYGTWSIPVVRNGSHSTVIIPASEVRYFMVTSWEEFRNPSGHPNGTMHARGARDEHEDDTHEHLDDDFDDSTDLNDLGDLDGYVNASRAEYRDTSMERNTLEHTDTELFTHTRGECAGERCTIHHRSDHPMRGYPQHWRADRGIIERICPHGVGHPDPDEYALTIGLDDGAHGCDGCCTGYVENNKTAPQTHNAENNITTGLFEELL